MLLSCSLEFWRSGDTWYVGDETHAALHVTLTGPRAAYEILNDSSHPTTRAIRRALEAVLPDQTYVKHFTVRAQHVSIDPNWRDELLQIARGVGVHNQAAQGRALRIWKNLYFRSQSEIRIAEALTAPVCSSFRTVEAGLASPRPERIARPTSSSAATASGAS